jgi:hypothetical protein
LFFIKFMIIVNYYPGSLGDTIIAQLSGLAYIKDQTNRTLLEYPSNLKHTDFYGKTLAEQQSIYKVDIAPWLSTHGIIGSHRFESFDYRQLDNSIKVISINPMGSLDTIVKYYKEKVFNLYPHPDERISTLINKIDNKYGVDSKHYAIIIQKYIKQWVENNILESDIILDIDKFINNPQYLNDFRQYYN